jgi:hypothetical protein
VSDDSPIFRESPVFRDRLTSDEPAPAPGAVQASAGEAYGRLLASHAATVPATPVMMREDRGLAGMPAALVVGAAVAFFGGLAWAGVVIETHYDIGILAWLIGAATGYAVLTVAGGPVETGSRVLAGVFAAGGIMVGKYVIFVHELRDAVSKFLTAAGLTVRPSIGYFDGRTRHDFFSEFSTAVRPIYILWIALAFFAAYRMAGGGRVFGRRPL